MHSSIIEKLKSNWGEKAQALECFAEIKYIDTLSSWACYVFAMDDDEKIVHCLIYSDIMGPEIHTMPLQDIKEMYNEHGQAPVIDTEFRAIRVVPLLRRLRHDT